MSRNKSILTPPPDASGPLCGGDEIYGCSYHCGDPECAQNQPAPVELEGEATSEGCAKPAPPTGVTWMPKSKMHPIQPAPAPLPELSDRATLRARLDGFADPVDAAITIIVAHESALEDLTRRVADAERRGDTWKVQANKNCQDMGLISKRLEDALARVRELEAEEEERKAGWQLAGDAARGLRVECDGDLGHEAEQIRAERDDLQAFNARVMAWALGRCECCEHSNAAGQGIPHVSKTCRECCNSDGTPNWTPLKEWEVRP